MQLIQTLACLTLIAACFSQQPPFQQPLTGKYLHLTDIHYDPLYLVNSDPHNNCHFGAGNAGKYGMRLFGSGDITVCDAPLILIEETIAFWQNKTATDKVDFILWTGDNSRHPNSARVLNISEDHANIRNITNLLAQAFPNTPLIPSIGNNDVFPHDNFESGANSSVGNFLGDLWQAYIPNTQLSMFKSYGFYNTSVTASLQVVSMNTMLLYRSNPYATDCNASNSSAAFMMQWYSNVLSDARRQGQSVIVSGHVPPHPSTFYPNCLNLYYELATEYQDVIVAHQYAHQHTDSFLMIPYTPNSSQSSKSSQFVRKQLAQMKQIQLKKQTTEKALNKLPYSTCAGGVINVVPSVVPSLNPTSRLVSYNVQYPHNFVQYTQYYANLTQANLEETLTIIPEYTFPDVFGVLDYSTDSWCQVNNMINANQTIAGMYQKFNLVSAM